MHAEPAYQLTPAPVIRGHSEPLGLSDGISLSPMVRKVMAEIPTTNNERRHGMADGMIEAGAWLDDASGLHVRGTEIWRYLVGAADFMRQRAEEIEAAIGMAESNAG